MGVFDWKHWAVIALVAVLLFGTRKLQGIGEDVGASIKGFRKAMREEGDAQTTPTCMAKVLEDEHGSAVRDCD